MPEMWAITEDTEGISCAIDDPVARLLCERPELRALSPRDLASVAGVSIAAAQAAILRLASQASGVKVVLRGVSFDEAIAEGGRSMGRRPIAYARNFNDAGELGLPSIPPLAQNPLALLAIGLAAGFALVFFLQRYHPEQ